ncbi:hypothetical protein [Gracilinema caldarium]|uniref:Uncharacterized protein n=1 Tax=Gracilinema caldarium (strain ATCC 51460 / DSM 7334 / H1) TaxID=744872 RepID=F8F365_GRAC1|nr:hypothetical protein [Gracilinema caldarium]AEJ20391.1 hypothetical protein Spica_2279 [Gracilinema caldarium DSM 7334]
MNSDIAPDAEAQLSLITQMMKESRETIFHLGFPSIVWGVTISIGTLISYIFSANAWYTAIAPLWGILFIFASLLNISYFRRWGFRERKSTLISRLFKDLWIFMLITTLLLWLSGLLLHKNLSFSFMFCFICIVVSGGYWLSATLSGLFLVRCLSIAWLIGSFTVLFVPEVWTPAIMGLWAFLFEAVPGLYLYVRERKESL